jgi:hypothetical protein
LYRGKYAELDECPVCELSRYKFDYPKAMIIVDRNKRPHKKVVWYFPKRLFANEKSVELMRWHAKKHMNDGKAQTLSRWITVEGY